MITVEVGDNIAACITFSVLFLSVAWAIRGNRK